MHVAKGTRSAALVSRHGPTCRRVAHRSAPPEFGAHVPVPDELPVDSIGDVVDRSG